MRRLRASIEDLMARFGGWILRTYLPSWEVKSVLSDGDNPVVYPFKADSGDVVLVIPLRRDR